MALLGMLCGTQFGKCWSKQYPTTIVYFKYDHKVKGNISNLEELVFSIFSTRYSSCIETKNMVYNFLGVGLLTEN